MKIVVSEVDYGMEEDRANTYSQLAIQPASSALALAVTDIASMVFNHIKSSLSTLAVYTVLIITMNTRLDATCEHYAPFPVSAASQKVLDCLIQSIKIVLTEYHGEDEDTWGHLEKNGPFSDDCDQRCIFVRRDLVVALASFEDSTSNLDPEQELQLKILKFLLAVVLFHETSHFLTRHIFGSEFTPKGIYHPVHFSGQIFDISGGSRFETAAIHRRTFNTNANGASSDTLSGGQLPSVSPDL